MTIKSWNTSTSQFDVTEHVETFDIDASGYSANAPAHDLAGNMTFDGTAKFTYDGWNRLVGVAHAYRDGSNNVQAGQKNVTMSYDGRGRRISKATANAGQWDATYHYYYDNDSLIETRDGSNYTIKHHTWGTRYIDELVRVTSVLTSDEGGGQISYEYSDYWACQDSNYNVLGVVDSSAVLKERYEYKPYGERVVFFSPGSNDVGCYAPTQVSRRVNQSGSDQPYGICEVGHQGLVHDEEIGLVYNRARQLHPGVGRFMQRDPSEYIDGLNVYQYCKSSALLLKDPEGKGCIGNEAITCAIKCSWKCCCIAGFLSGEALTVAAQQTDLGSNADGEQDAFRHCYWGCRSAQACSAYGADANCPLRAHEDCSTNSPEQKAMDLHNNAVGVGIGNGQALAQGPYCKDKCRERLPPPRNPSPPQPQLIVLRPLPT